MSITFEKILSYDRDKLLDNLSDKKNSNKTDNELFILFAKKSSENNTLVDFQKKIVENKNFEKEFKKERYKKNHRSLYLLNNLHNIKESYDLKDIFYLEENILDQLYEFWSEKYYSFDSNIYRISNLFKKKDLFVKIFKYPIKNKYLINEKYQKYIESYSFLNNLYYNKNFDDFLNFFALAENKEDAYKFIYGEKNLKKVLIDRKYQFNNYYYYNNDLFLNILKKLIKTFGMDFFEFIKLNREYYFLFLNNSTNKNIYNKNSYNKNLILYKIFKKLIKKVVINENNYFLLELLDFIQFLFSEKRNDITDMFIDGDSDMIFLQKIKNLVKIDINYEILIDFILSFTDGNTNYINNLQIFDLTEEDFINITKFISSNFFKSKRNVAQAKLVFDKIKNNKNLKYFNLLSYKNFNLDDKINILTQLKLYEKFDHLKHKSLAFLYFRSLFYPNKIRNDIMEDIIASFIFKLNKDDILKDYTPHNREFSGSDTFFDYNPHFLEQIIKYILNFFSLRFFENNNFLVYSYNFLNIFDTLDILKDLNSLKGFIRPFLNNQNINNNTIYTQGVNVHNEQRDQKTENAIFQLYQTWIPNEKKIEKYFKKFEKYIKKLDLPEKKKNDLDRVIYGKDRKTTDFGGFLTSCTIINGKRVEGKELIARFWRFILKYKEDENLSEIEIEKEIENLKHGFIMALLSSVNNNGNVVCDPGKKQRIVVAILQNRLKADGKFIKIDDYFEDEEDKTQEKQIEMIKDFNLIHKHLKPFVNYYMYEEETRITNINDFFNKLFKYIHDISSSQSKVDLHVYYVVYYCVMLTMTEDGLIINPNLSLCSNFEDMYDISNYLNIFLKKEEDEFDLQFPEIKEKRIKKLENQEKIKNISEKMKERAKKERYRLEYKEKYGKSPEG
uniref:Uncharacterized protein n=1 Tax=viral metagenome TaxID=1070528 RepID=A0A6C0AFS2_9ZZZZ